MAANPEPKVERPATLDRVLHALGDPVRLGIVRQLARDGESSCAALNGGRSKSTMSHHFRVLREAGLVQTRNQGVTHLNALCRGAIEARYPGLLAAVVDAACRDGVTCPGPAQTHEGALPPGREPPDAGPG